MHIHQVLAVFTNQESPDAKIILTGEPERVKETSRGEAGQITFYSNVLLNAEIPVDAVPGLYKCGRVLAETVTGKLVAFDDPPNDTIDWELWVLVEPTTPPKFGIS